MTHIGLLVALAFPLLLAMPASAQPAATTLAEPARMAVFDRIWGTIDRGFYAPDFNGVDWKAVGARYRPLVAAAPSDMAAVPLVQQMLRELKVSHVNLLRASDVAATAGERPSAERDAVSWNQQAPGIGLIRLARFDQGQEHRDRLDRAFAELDLSRGLILDLRGNSGGGLSLGMRLADHLYTAKRPLGLFATREGLVRGGVNTITGLDAANAFAFDGYEIDAFNQALMRHGAVQLVSGGRAPGARERRVVVLIDRRSASAAEAVAGAFGETGATIIGERSAGAMLSSATFPMGGGFYLRLPVADHRTPGGRRLEGQGVEPTVAVPSAEALTRAVAVLSDTGGKG